jgi:hypothetical protein
LLSTAQVTAEDMVNEARTRVETMLYDARTTAETLQRQSRDKAASLEQEATRKYARILDARNQGKILFENTIDDLRAFEQEYRAQLTILCAVTAPRAGRVRIHRTSRPNTYSAGRRGLRARRTQRNWPIPALTLIRMSGIRLTTSWEVAA